MALKKCKECDNLVSTKAKSCPNCGVPVKKLSAGSIALILIIIMFVAVAIRTDDTTPKQSFAQPHKLPLPTNDTSIITENKSDDKGNPRIQKKKEIREKMLLNHDKDEAVTPISTDALTHSPNKVVERWRQIGLAVEIPWRRSKWENPDYKYISQCRGWVGKEGSSLFKTEIECEILGLSKNTATQYSVSLELWNKAYSKQGYKLALLAIDQIGHECPNSIIQAFKNKKSFRDKQWEVKVEPLNDSAEIHVYYYNNK